MSIESWKEEFYTEDAWCVSQDGSDLQLVEHCLKKWEGLRPENLKEHGLKQVMFKIVEINYENESFYTDCNSCSLCQKYDQNDCSDCPITLSRGYACSEEGDWIEGTDEDEREPAPWYQWTTGGNPEPMLKCLLKAKDYVK